MSLNDKMFKLEISTDEKKDSIFVNLCLKCISPTCSPIIDILKSKFTEEEYEQMLCLVQAAIETYTTTKSDSYFNVHYKANLIYFYNHISKYENYLILNRKLKGGEVAFLLILLLSSLSRNDISVDDNIVVDILGELNKEDKLELIDYYESLGFKISHPDMVSKSLSKKLGIPMYAKIEDVVSICNSFDFSDELIEIISDQNKY